MWEAKHEKFWSVWQSQQRERKRKKPLEIIRYIFFKAYFGPSSQSYSNYRSTVILVHAHATFLYFSLSLMQCSSRMSTSWKTHECLLQSERESFTLRTHPLFCSQSGENVGLTAFILIPSDVILEINCWNLNAVSFRTQVIKCDDEGTWRLHFLTCLNWLNVVKKQCKFPLQN